MNTLEPKSWEETEEWRSVVNAEWREEFLSQIANASADGEPVKAVLVVDGVPIVYHRRYDLD